LLLEESRRNHPSHRRHLLLPIVDGRKSIFYTLDFARLYNVDHIKHQFEGGKKVAQLAALSGPVKTTNCGPTSGP